MVVPFRQARQGPEARRAGGGQGPGLWHGILYVSVQTHVVRVSVFEGGGEHCPSNYTLYCLPVVVVVSLLYGLGSGEERHPRPFARNPWPAGVWQVEAIGERRSRDSYCVHYATRHYRTSTKYCGWLLVWIRERNGPGPDPKISVA